MDRVWIAGVSVVVPRNLLFSLKRVSLTSVDGLVDYISGAI